MDQSPTGGFRIPISIAIILGCALIAVAVYFVGQGQTGNTSTQGQPASTVVDPSKISTDGEPYVGDPHAPLTIVYWYDYQCPFCQRQEQEVIPQIIKNYVEAGKARIVFKDYQFLGPDSHTLAQYSRAVWEVAPNKFYDWHKTIFENQGTENTGWATKEKILSLTKGVLGQGDTNKVAALVANKGDEYQKEIDADRAEGAAVGITGTPAAVIGNERLDGAVPYSAFQQVIESQLRGS